MDSFDKPLFALLEIDPDTNKAKFITADVNRDYVLDLAKSRAEKMAALERGFVAEEVPGDDDIDYFVIETADGFKVVYKYPGDDENHPDTLARTVWIYEIQESCE